MAAVAPSIVWFRNDLRIADHPALKAALDRGGAIVPVFIWAPEEEGAWVPGGASRWWLHQSLTVLSEQLASVGSRLVIRSGASLAILRGVVEEVQAEAVFWNRRYEPHVIRRDSTIKESLRSDGLTVESFNGSCLFEPMAVRNQQGEPYKVFTAYWRACMKLRAPTAPEKAPKQLKPPKSWPKSVEPSDLGLEPLVDWAAGMREAWTPGERGAQAQLRRFLDDACDDYAKGRNRPDRRGTSRLSPHLHFGEISPNQVWHAVRKHESKTGDASAGVFLRELGWREFAHHLLYHFPDTPTQPLRDQFRRFAWAKESKTTLAAWQDGATGYPIVDAGMRELWTTGWMHNRVRMIVGSFLVKHLLINWREGAAWFWDTLVDADLANNTLGWQWIAGCGADAAPYFRIFNPILQGKKFDPKGDYVRKWVPEIAGLATKWIHSPWEAPADALEQAGIRLDDDYPAPIVDHGSARKRALRAFEEVKR